MPVRAGLVLPRVLTPALALAHGVTRAEWRTALSRGYWTRIARGVWLTRVDQPNRWDWAAAGLALGDESAALTGWDAARLCGVGDRRPPLAPVLVLTATGQSHQVGGVHLLRTTRRYARWTTSPQHPDLPLAEVVALPRAVTDAAVHMRSLDPVRALLTSALRERRCSYAALADEARRAPRRGSAHLRRALSDAGAGARSAAEAQAISRLRSAQIPAFEVNVPVVDRDGRLLYELDLFWRELRFAIEVDSREYHFELLDWERTMLRHNELSRRGLAIEHHSPAAITAPGRTWVREVESALRRRASELGVPYVATRRVIATPDGERPPAYLVDPR